MPTSRVMKNALAGFLGTYISRYSDYRGYWLHGQLPFDAYPYDFDLLGLASDVDTPESAAWQLAIHRFKEQVIKSGLEISAVCKARLRICMDARTVKSWQGDQMREGHMVEFVVVAYLNTTHRYEHRQVVFIAPHDPLKERPRLLC